MPGVTSQNHWTPYRKDGRMSQEQALGPCRPRASNQAEMFKQGGLLPWVSVRTLKAEQALPAGTPGGGSRGWVCTVSGPDPSAGKPVRPLGKSKDSRVVVTSPCRVQA